MLMVAEEQVFRPLQGLNIAPFGALVSQQPRQLAALPASSGMLLRLQHNLQCLAPLLMAVGCGQLQPP